MPMCIHSYSHFWLSSPRSLCIEGMEVQNGDPEVTHLLSTERALSIYLDLVALIREETRRNATMNEADTTSDSRVLKSLFPSTETRGVDGRNYWLEKKVSWSSLQIFIISCSVLHLTKLILQAVLVRATTRWARVQKAVSCDAILRYLDVLSPGEDTADVDDFLWLVMMSWVKSAKVVRDICYLLVSFPLDMKLMCLSCSTSHFCVAALKETYHLREWEEEM